jgi:hypothetical protein
MFGGYSITDTALSVLGKSIAFSRCEDRIWQIGIPQGPMGI